MRKLIIACCFIFTFPFVTFSIDRLSADSLVKKGRYLDAALELERLCFIGDSKDKNDLLMQKALCLRWAGEYERASATLDRIPLFFVTDSVRKKIVFERALNYYLSGRFAQAEGEVRVLEDQFQGKLPGASVILYALILNEQQKWEDAKAMLLANASSGVFGSDSVAAKNEILALYSNANIPRLKSKDKAFWLSFLPGAGIAYGGEPLEGALNFVLNAAAFGFGVYEIYYGYYLTGYFTGGILLEKFYLGGRKRADFLVDRSNYERAKGFNLQAKASLMK